MTNTANYEAQLVALYQERETLAEAFPGHNVHDILELARSVQAQLDDLMDAHLDAILRERQELLRSFPGMTIAEIIEAARAGLGVGQADAEARLAESMEAQLIDLYAEKEALNGAFPGKDGQEVVASIQQKVRLLESFYASQAA